MKKKNGVLLFTLKCILVPAAAIWLILCINKPYRKINEKKYLDITKFFILESEYEEVNIGNLGSSHGAYDFDYTPLTERGYSCFNFANTSQSYDYDYAVLKEYGHYMSSGSVMFIPVSYFSFNNEVINKEEAQAMSLRYYHFLSPKNIPNYDAYVDIITNRLPILTAGEDILELLPNLQLSITAFAAEEDSLEINVEEFAKRAKERYSRHFDNKEEYFMPERIDELESIISYCKKHSIIPVLITTPFSKYYLDLVSMEFLQDFYDTIGTITTDTNVNYYDYSNDTRFYDHLEYFSDCDHLNGEGALYFTEILMEEVSELQKYKKSGSSA